MTAYYNENDSFAAAWLRKLIKKGLIVPGEVDERSIEEVRPDDFRGFTQCHFFAGIGVWSYALRLAGFPDDRPVWTGSCPCPSFSAAGQGKGFEDPRHLWPRWFGLIRESRPATIFGEQADKAIGFGWLDLVQTDLEAEGYAVGATVFGAHSVGAPHIRQRLYFVADSLPAGRAEGRPVSGIGPTAGRGVTRKRSDSTEPRSARRKDGHADCDDASTIRRGSVEPERSGKPRITSNADGGNASTKRLQRSGQHGLCAEDRQPCERADSKHRRQAYEESGSESRRCNGFGFDPNGPGSFAGQQAGAGMGYGSAIESASSVSDGEHSFRSRLEGLRRDVREWRGPGWLDPDTARSIAETGATRGYWGDCDWWFGRDGKYRPIGAGLFPLVAGATGTMGKLRGYGNALCAPQAQAFIEAYMSLERWS